MENNAQAFINNQNAMTIFNDCKSHSLKEKKIIGQQLGLGLELTQEGSDIDLFEVAGADYILQLQQFVKANIDNPGIQCLVQEEIVDCSTNMHTLNTTTYSAYLTSDSILIIAEDVNQEGYSIDSEGEWIDNDYAAFQITKAIFNPSPKVIANEVSNIVKDTTSYMMNQEINQQKQNHMRRLNGIKNMHEAELGAINKEAQKIREELICKSNIIEEMTRKFDDMKRDFLYEQSKVTYVQEESAKHLDVLLTEMVKPNLSQKLYCKLLALIHGKESMLEYMQLDKAQLCLKLLGKVNIVN